MASWPPLSHKNVINKTGGISVLQITRYRQTDMGVIPSISNNTSILPIPSSYYLY